MRESACTNHTYNFQSHPWFWGVNVWSIFVKGYALWLETSPSEPTLYTSHTNTRTQWVTSFFPTIFVPQETYSLSTTKGKEIRCLYPCVCLCLCIHKYVCVQMFICDLVFVYLHVCRCMHVWFLIQYVVPISFCSSLCADEREEEDENVRQ